MISIEYYYTCFHFDTVSSVQVSPRNVQVIMICYSENRRSFVAICCGHVGTIAYYVMHVLYAFVLQIVMVPTAVNLLESTT